jgi:hypothetical protein
MATLWNELGWIRWPLLLSLVSVTGLAAWSGVRLFLLDRQADLRTKAWVDAILFWGGFGMISGVLGTLIGIIIAAQFIEAANGQMSPAMVWGGIKVALVSSATGMLILAWAALLWFALQLRWRLLEAKALQTA